MLDPGSDRLSQDTPGFHPEAEGSKHMIRIDVLNFLIVWSFIVIGRFAANVLAALTHDSPVGQALSLIAA